MQGPEHGARRDWVRSGEVVWVQIRPYEKMRIHTVEVEAQSDPGPDPALKKKCRTVAIILVLRLHMCTKEAFFGSGGGGYTQSSNALRIRIRSVGS